ncbi:MAG: hypothetical protein IPM59_12845 [Chloracidobacterium sp.]|nr:hypothetical protein [Chloracidobacterium sp.]
MTRICAAFVMTILFGGSAFAQPSSTAKQAVMDKVDGGVTEAVSIARAAVAAHGGEKLRQMRSLLVRGSADIAATPSQVIPASFVLALAGERYFFELNNPIQPLKQIFDGKRLYSAGQQLPPMNSLGFPLLQKVGENGYAITAAGDTKKKKKGFRITTLDGFFTDFYVDEKTGQIKAYESAYEMMGRTVTTSVEIDEMAIVEGVTIPKRYSQRFDLGPFTAYAAFNAREIMVDRGVSDDLFAIPR